MNYGRVRSELKKHQEKLKEMAPKDRVLLEQKIIEDAQKEPAQEKETEEKKEPAQEKPKTSVRK